MRPSVLILAVAVIAIVSGENRRAAEQAPRYSSECPTIIKDDTLVQHEVDILILHSRCWENV